MGNIYSITRLYLCNLYYLISPLIHLVRLPRKESSDPMSDMMNCGDYLTNLITLSVLSSDNLLVDYDG